MTEDTLFQSAVTLMAGRPGWSFEMALGAVMDLRESFDAMMKEDDDEDA